MIPPVEERQIRPCETCHCYWEAPCYHDGVGCSILGDRATREKGDIVSYSLLTKLQKMPCRLHLTESEYKELIGNLEK